MKLLEYLLKQPCMLPYLAKLEPLPPDGVTAGVCEVHRRLVTTQSLSEVPSLLVLRVIVPTGNVEVLH